MTESMFLKALFDGMRCGILCIDCHGRMLVVNDLAIQVLGLTSNRAPNSTSLSRTTPGSCSC